MDRINRRVKQTNEDNADDLLLHISKWIKANASTIRRRILQLAGKASATSVLIGFLKAMIMLQMAYVFAPELLVPSNLHEFLPLLISTVLVTVFLAALLVVVIELCLGYVPSLLLGSQWRESSWTRIVAQSIIFGYLISSFDHYLGYYAVVIPLSIGFHALVEAVTRVGSTEVSHELTAEAYLVRTDLHIADRVLLAVLSVIALVFGTSLIVMVIRLLFIPSMPSVEFHLGSIVLYTAIGVLLSELVRAKLESHSPKRILTALLLPSVALVILGLDWNRLPYPSSTNGFWVLFGIVSLVVYIIARPRLVEPSIWIRQKLTEEGLRDDQVFLRRILALMGFHFSVVFIYQLSGARFVATFTRGLPMQIVWDCFDPRIFFPVSYGFFGISMFGFILPLILMLYIVTIKSRQWGLRLDRDFFIALSGTSIISILFLEVRSTGLYPTFASSVLITTLALMIALNSKWEMREAKALQLFAAFWLGVIPADFLYGLSVLHTRFSIQYVCVGGSGWGFGDGLWSVSFLALVSLLVALYITGNDCDGIDDEISGAENDIQHEVVISESQKKRFFSVLLSPLAVLLALVLHFTLIISWIFWAVYLERLYPIGVFQAPAMSFPDIATLWGLAVLVLTASFLLEILDILIRSKRVQWTFNPRQTILLKGLIIAGISTVFVSVMEGGFLAFFPFAFFLEMAATYVLIGLLVETGPPSRPSYEEGVEATRRISPRLTVALVIFLVVFYTRSFPYIMLTRFAQAVLLTTMTLLACTIIIGVGFFVAWALFLPLASGPTLETASKYKELGQLLIAAVLVTEVGWSLLSMPLIVPLVTFATWGAHRVLVKYWPTRFAPTLVRISVKELYKTDIPNYKAVLLCMLLIVGPTLVANEIQTFASPHMSISEVRVAIIDDGINTEASTLREHVVAQRSFVDPSFGYEKYEPDPLPQTLFTSHGTKIAYALLDVFPDAALVNARVRSSSDDFTLRGFEAAIHWCVNEANASVISLSFGRNQYDIENGPYDEILEWAWSQGVLVVASAGNENQISWSQGGLGTIGYPGATLWVMAVGATNSSNEVHPQSSRGPAPDGTLKPDIMAPGYLWDNDLLWGTSLSSPRVAGAAGLIIDMLEREGVPWTPGLIRAALMEGASDIDHPEYEVGSGLLNVDEALRVVQNAPRDQDGLPQVVSVLPTRIPLDIEYVFAGVNLTERVTVVCSSMMTLSVDVSSSLDGIVHGSQIDVNQCGVLDLILTPPDLSVETQYEGRVNLASTYASTSIDISFSARVPKARLAIDASHDKRNWYTTYMLHSEYYNLLCERGIAVTEIRSPDDFIGDRLMSFDALVMLNPFASWWGNERDFRVNEREAVESFVDAGGALLFALDGSSNTTAVNLMLNWTGISLLPGRTRSSALNVTEHSITTGIDYPDEDYYENRPSFCTFNTTANFTWVLWFPEFFMFPPEAILACGEVAGRVAAFGRSEWFQNNWVRDLNRAEAQIVLRMTEWVLDLL